nr:hypothetical protein ORM20_00222 [Ochrobactrum phage ORM_20]
MQRYSYDELFNRLDSGVYQKKMKEPSSENPYIKLKEPTTADEVDAYAEKLKKSLNWKEELKVLRKEFRDDQTRLDNLFIDDLMNSFFPESTGIQRRNILNFIFARADTKVERIELASDLSDIFPFQGDL